MGSVTPFSARALDRGFAGALVGLARHSQPELTPPQGVERIADARAALERRLLDRFLERVRSQPFADEAEREERLRSVQNRIVDLLDSWRKVVDDYRAAGVAVQYQKYEQKQPRPLLREMLDTAFESEHHRKFRANRSLRDVEPEVNLFLKDFSGERRGGSRMSSQGARADPPRPGDHHLWTRRVDRSAAALGDRRRPRHLAEAGRPRGDRRSRGSRASSQIMTGVPAPRLYAPPPDPNDPRETARGIGAWRFPEWFVVQDERGREDRERSRRLVHRKALDEQGALRRPRRRRHPLRARLSERARRRSRLAPLRARAR